MAVRISAPLLSLPLQGPRAVPRRPFFSLSSLAPTQTLSATRSLPYKSAPLFALIADVDTYAEFVPYCIGSRVTHWSPGTTKRVDSWPTQADLYIGFGSFNEAYTSRLRCDPALGIVEARSGTDVVPFLPPHSHQPLSKHDGQSAQQASHPGALAASAVGTFPSTLSVFTSLVTTWRIKDLLKPPVDANTTTVGGDWTQVDLDLKFRFANPLYSAVSRAVSDQLAALMIEAFEKQARKKLGDKGL